MAAQPAAGAIRTSGGIRAESDGMVWTFRAPNSRMWGKHYRRFFIATPRQAIHCQGINKGESGISHYGQYKDYQIVHESWRRKNRSSSEEE